MLLWSIYWFQTRERLKLTNIVIVVVDENIHNLTFSWVQYCMVPHCKWCCLWLSFGIAHPVCSTGLSSHCRMDPWGPESPLVQPTLSLRWECISQMGYGVPWQLNGIEQSTIVWLVVCPLCISHPQTAHNTHPSMLCKAQTCVQLITNQPIHNLLDSTSTSPDIPLTDLRWIRPSSALELKLERENSCLTDLFLMNLGVAVRSKDSFISELWCSRASLSYGILKLTDRAQTTFKWDFCVSRWEKQWISLTSTFKKTIVHAKKYQGEGFVNSPSRW